MKRNNRTTPAPFTGAPMRYAGIFSLALPFFILSCASNNFAEIPAAPAQTEGNPLLAIVNGEPVFRNEVVRQAMHWHEKEYLEEFIRWKLIQQKRKELGVVNGKEEMESRAELAIKTLKADFGDVEFSRYLKDNKLTEADIKNAWIAQGNIDTKLANEKMTQYALISEKAIAIDIAIFYTEEEAKKFLASIGNNEELFREKFDALAKEPTHKVRLLSLKPFPAGMAPSFIDEKTEKELFAMEEGEVSNPLFVKIGFMIAKNRSKRDGLRQEYKAIEKEIFEQVMKNPPDDSLISQWIERLRKRGDVRYENRNSQGN